MYNYLIPAFVIVRAGITDAVKQALEGIGDKIAESFQNLVSNMFYHMFEKLQELIGTIVTSLMDGITDVVVDTFDASTDLFYSMFPFLRTTATVLVWTAFSLLLVLFVFQLLRNFFGPATDAEAPLPLLARTLGAAFLIFNAQLITTEILDFASHFITVLREVPNVVTTTSMNDGEYGMFVVIYQTIYTICCINPISGTIVLISALLGLILVIALAWNYLKLILEICERYIVTGILCALSPLAFACFGSKTTLNIFKAYLRMFGSSILLIFLNVWFLRGFNSAVGSLVATDGVWAEGGVFASNPTTGAIMFIICMIAYLKVAQKFDSYLAQLGLNTAQTGGFLLGEIAMAGMAVGSAISRTANGIADAATGHGRGVLGAVFGGGNRANNANAPLTASYAGGVGGINTNQNAARSVLDGQHKGVVTGNDANKMLRDSLDPTGQKYSNITNGRIANGSYSFTATRADGSGQELVSGVRNNSGGITTTTKPLDQNGKVMKDENGKDIISSQSTSSDWGFAAVSFAPNQGRNPYTPTANNGPAPGTGQPTNQTGNGPASNGPAKNPQPQQAAMDIDSARSSQIAANSAFNSTTGTITGQTADGMAKSLFDPDGSKGLTFSNTSIGGGQMTTTATDRNGNATQHTVTAGQTPNGTPAFVDSAQKLDANGNPVGNAELSYRNTLATSEAANYTNTLNNGGSPSPEASPTKTDNPAGGNQNSDSANAATTNSSSPASDNSETANANAAGDDFVPINLFDEPNFNADDYTANGNHSAGNNTADGGDTHTVGDNNATADVSTAAPNGSDNSNIGDSPVSEAPADASANGNNISEEAVAAAAVAASVDSAPISETPVSDSSSSEAPVSDASLNGNNGSEEATTVTPASSESSNIGDAPATEVPTESSASNMSEEAIAANSAVTGVDGTPIPNTPASDISTNGNNVSEEATTVTPAGTNNSDVGGNPITDIPSETSSIGNNSSEGSFVASNGADGTPISEAPVSDAHISGNSVSDNASTVTPNNSDSSNIGGAPIADSPNDTSVTDNNISEGAVPTAPVETDSSPANVSNDTGYSGNNGGIGAYEAVQAGYYTGVNPLNPTGNGFGEEMPVSEEQVATPSSGNSSGYHSDSYAPDGFTDSYGDGNNSQHGSSSSPAESYSQQPSVTDTSDYSSPVTQQSEGQSPVHNAPSGDSFTSQSDAYNAGNSIPADVPTTPSYSNGDSGVGQSDAVQPQSAPISYDSSAPAPVDTQPGSQPISGLKQTEDYYSNPDNFVPIGTGRNGTQAVYYSETGEKGEVRRDGDKYIPVTVENHTFDNSTESHTTINTSPQRENYSSRDSHTSERGRPTETAIPEDEWGSRSGNHKKNSHRRGKRN